MRKKFFALLLCVLICLSLLPVLAFAEEYEVGFWTTDDQQLDTIYVGEEDNYLIGVSAPNKQTMAEVGKTHSLGCFQGWRIRRTEIPFDVNNTQVEEDIDLTAIWSSTHSWENGICSSCNTVCSHTEWDSTTGRCKNCNMLCSHDWSDHNGTCKTCGLACGHDWSDHNGTCKTCGLACSHDWSDHNGTCKTCGLTCQHDWSEGNSICKICGLTCGHDWSDHNGSCKTCGLTCQHDWSNHNGTCKICGKTCEHDWSNHSGSCRTCGMICEEHDWSDHNGTCKNCGTTCEHSWGTMTTSNATCSRDGLKTRTCQTCGKTETETIEKLNPNGIHQWENGTCKVCHISGYSVTVTWEGPGSAKLNNGTVSNGQTVTFEPETQISVSFFPDPEENHAHLVGIHISGEAINNEDNTYTFTPQSAGSCTVNGIFRAREADAEPKGISRPSPIPVEDRAAAEGLRETLAGQNHISKDEVSYSIFNVTPCWDGDPSDPLAPEEVEEWVEEEGKIPFRLFYPTGVDMYNQSNYEFLAFHIAGSEEPEEATILYDIENGVMAESDKFSTFALFAFPKNQNNGSSTNPSTGGTTLVPNPDVPNVKPRDRVDEGSTREGAILDVDSRMEYRKSGDSTYTQVGSGVTEISGLSAGTYYVRFKKTGTMLPSEDKVIKIHNLYTVRAKHLYGNGWYEIEEDYPNYNGDDDIYLVPRGETITFLFHPDNHYWLYAIYKNDVYVGQSNVKTTYRLKDVQEKTVIAFGFSASSASPKTGDDNQVTRWIVEEVISLLGMTAITWYLFRRKETY